MSSLNEILRTIPPEDYYQTDYFIDEVRLHSELPTRRGVLMILHRAYRSCAEKSDIVSGKAGWVKLRKALNQPRGVDDYA